MSTHLREFLLYAVASALALALDASVLHVVLALGWGLPLAAAAGFLSGLVWMYVVSVRHIFRTQRHVDVRLQFLVFAGIGIAGLGLTETLLALLVTRQGLSPLSAKLLSATAVFLFNFTARKALLFTVRPFAVTSAER